MYGGCVHGLLIIIIIIILIIIIIITAIEQNIFNSRKGQRTNQKYRNLVGSDQQMQRLEETELRKADRTVGVQQILQCLKITFERLPLVRGPIGDSLSYLDNLLGILIP